jgi:hypothetical protein
MTTSTDRQTFRETVALVAAKAKAILPEETNGRVESAARLVLLRDVSPQADGTILVGSSSDPMKQYRLQGAQCSCQDFQYGKAPQGWCAHRIAAGIHKRVGELLPQSTPVETEPVEVPEDLEPWADNDFEEPEPEAVETPCAPTPPPPLPEAAFSLTLKGTLGGVDALLTVRGHTPAEFQRHLQSIKGLLDATPQPATPAQPLSPQQHKAITGVCAIHQVEMHWNEGKDGRKGWYSHRHDGQWCKGR